MFIQLQGIVFIQLQVNYIIVNFQGNIFTQRKCIHSKKLFVRSRNYIHFNKIIFIEGILFIQFKKIIFIQGIAVIQGNYIHSKK